MQVTNKRIQNVVVFLTFVDRWEEMNRAESISALASNLQTNVFSKIIPSIAVVWTAPPVVDRKTKRVVKEVTGPSPFAAIEALIPKMQTVQCVFLYSCPPHTTTG